MLGLPEQEGYSSTRTLLLFFTRRVYMAGRVTLAVLVKALLGITRPPETTFLRHA